MITKLSFSLILHTFPKCLSRVVWRVLEDFAPPRGYTAGRLGGWGGHTLAMHLGCRFAR